MIKEYFRNYRWNTCDVTLSLGREATVEFHDRHSEEDWTVTLADTGEESLTGYRIKLIESYIPKGESFFLTYGDGLGNIDVNDCLKVHRDAKKACTVTAVHPAGRFGSLKIDDSGRIHTFNEKPQVEEAYVNGGYMVCEHKLFQYMSGEPLEAFERIPIGKLVSDGQLNSYRHEGWWQPMDTYQEMQYLDRLWVEGKAPWKVW